MDTLVSLFSVFKKKKKQIDTYRSIDFHKLDQKYQNNKIKTTQYTLLSFFPLNIYKQFQISANIYFLVIGILQTIHAISNSQGRPVIFIPLAFVVIASMIKDFFEDLKRRFSDQFENQQKILKRDKNCYSQEFFQNIQVGDFIRVEKNKQIPCDLLILYSTDKKGSCFLETKNLDGETSLKRKYINQELRDILDQEQKIYETQANFEYMSPTVYLDEFHGVLNINDKKITIDSNSILLRGCSLQNTDYIIGLACYTGQDTKVMLNSIPSRKKYSKIEIQLYKQIVYVAIIQHIFCLFCSTFNTIMSYDDFLLDSLGFEFEFHYQEFLTIYGSWILILTNFIPISLIVSLESVKLIQGIYMENDLQFKNKGKQIFQVNSSNLNESLGQVQCIFSDKTGTLTQNKMMFKNICINGQSYGQVKNENQSQEQDISEYNKSQYQNINHDSNSSSVNNLDISQFVDFKDDNFQKEINQNQIRESLICLGVCNQIIAEQSQQQLKYTGASPDEIALVYFAAHVGMILQPENENGIISIHDQNLDKNYQFRILHVLEFTSKFLQIKGNRQRMSIIVKNLQNNQIEIYMKGADNIMIEKIQIKDEQSNYIMSQTKYQLNKYGTDGLRTLVLAKKTIDEVQFLDWEIQYKNAKNLQGIQNLFSSLRFSKNIIFINCFQTIIQENREYQMEQLQSQIENNFDLIGATAIEDKLQENVSQTIRRLRDVGIYFWILTGDKVETAINIAQSTNLFKAQDYIHVLNQKTQFEIELALINIYDKIKFNKKQIQQLVITGDSLRILNENQNMINKFMQVSLQFDVILACRVSPKQKQELVKQFKDYHPDTTTLAIGDGANDVNMITEAHIGIGIKGVEGSQAARASDYSINQFQNLQPLLLYYGREFYRRNTDIIFYNFYKNFLLVMCMFWFGFISNFSGVFLFEIWIFQCFNILYSSFPIMLYGVFDHQFPAKVLLQNSILYKSGMNNSLYNNKKFTVNFLSSFLHSGIIVLFSIICLDENFVYNNQTSGLQNTGMFIFSALVIVSNLKILTYQNEMNILQILAFLFSIISYYTCLYLISQSQYHKIYHNFQIQFYTPNCYLAMILIVQWTFCIDLAEAKHKLVKTQQKTLQNKIILNEELQKLNNEDNNYY